MGIFQRFRLAADRFDDAGMAMAQAGNGRSARGVQITLAGGIGDVDALAGDGGGQLRSRVAVENMGHDLGSLPE